MARRRYISTKISKDKAVNRLATEYGDFAVMLYTWMIPHAADDGTLSGDPEEILYEVIPGRRDKTPADVEAALKGMVACDLIAWYGGSVCFPADSFYGYQTYIKPANRRGANIGDKPPSAPIPATNSGEQRKTPQNAASPSVTPSPSPSPRENVAADASAPPRSRAPDAEFEALCEVCYQKSHTDITTRERGKLNTARSELRTVPDATADEIKRRGQHYTVMWPDLGAPSPTALSGNWTNIGNDLAKRQNGQANHAANRRSDEDFRAALVAEGVIPSTDNGRSRDAARPEYVPDVSRINQPHRGVQGV